MNTLKLTAIILVSILAAVLILQNTQATAITLIFWRVTLPAAVWLLFTLLIGFTAGITLSMIFKARGKKPVKSPHQDT